MFKFCLLVVVILVLGSQIVEGMVGGDDTQPGQYRYHAMLKNGNHVFCNGALITLSHVLTAGHCVAGSNKLSGKLTAVVGTNRWRRRDISDDNIFKIVAKVHHPAFKYQKTDLDLLNDIGIFMGDSGAPLVHNGYVIGVLSGAIGCAIGYPDIFTSVYHHADWIAHATKTLRCNDGMDRDLGCRIL